MIKQFMFNQKWALETNSNNKNKRMQKCECDVGSIRVGQKNLNNKKLIKLSQNQMIKNS